MPLLRNLVAEDSAGVFKNPGLQKHRPRVRGTQRQQRGRARRMSADPELSVGFLGIYGVVPGEQDCDGGFLPCASPVVVLD